MNYQSGNCELSALSVSVSTCKCAQTRRRSWAGCYMPDVFLATCYFMIKLMLHRFLFYVPRWLGCPYFPTVLWSYMQIIRHGRARTGRGICLPVVYFSVSHELLHLSYFIVGTLRSCLAPNNGPHEWKWETRGWLNSRRFLLFHFSLCYTPPPTLFNGTYWIWLWSSPMSLWDGIKPGGTWCHPPFLSYWPLVVELGERLWWFWRSMRGIKCVQFNDFVF